LTAILSGEASAKTEAIATAVNGAGSFSEAGPFSAMSRQNSCSNKEIKQKSLTIAQNAKIHPRPTRPVPLVPVPLVPLLESNTFFNDEFCHLKRQFLSFIKLLQFFL
jgi:hypothetical protein